MRERLIQLITQKQDVGRVYSQATSVVVPNKELAEHLLANGVVVGDHKQSEGEWKMQTAPITRCSVCGMPRNFETQFGWKYCPECGAKMKVGAE